MTIPPACLPSRVHTLAAAALLALCSVSAAAQKSTSPAPRPSGGISAGSSGTPYGTPSSGSNAPFGANSPFPPAYDDRLENSRAQARAAERQKRMVEDANRLVALTTRYRASVADHGTETIEDARMLLEIEKLARSVKDRMRGM